MIVSSLFDNITPGNKIGKTDAPCSSLFCKELQQARQHTDQEDSATLSALMPAIIQQLVEIFARWSPDVADNDTQGKSDQCQQNASGKMLEVCATSDPQQLLSMVLLATPTTLAAANPVDAAPAMLAVDAAPAMPELTGQSASENQRVTGTISGAQKSPAATPCFIIDFSDARPPISPVSFAGFGSQPGPSVAKIMVKGETPATVEIQVGQTGAANMMTFSLPYHNQQSLLSKLRSGGELSEEATRSILANHASSNAAESIPSASDSENQPSIRQPGDVLTTNPSPNSPPSRQLADSAEIAALSNETSGKQQRRTGSSNTLADISSSPSMRPATPESSPASSPAFSQAKLSMADKFTQTMATTEERSYRQENMMPPLQNALIRIEHDQTQIQIRMKMQGNGLQAELHVHETAMFESLQNNLRDLRQSLWQSGIHAERIEVFISDNGNAAFADSSPQQSRNSFRQPAFARNIASAQGSLAVAETVVSGRAKHPGQLSYYV